MSYVDVNVPVIERITLPSGNTYYVADREIRDVVDAISQTIAGGVSFIIAWDGNSTPVESQIPAGVAVYYEGDVYVGSLSTASAQPGAFYLVKSSSQPGATIIENHTNTPTAYITIHANSFLSAVGGRSTDDIYNLTCDPDQSGDWFITGQGISGNVVVSNLGNAGFEFAGNPPNFQPGDSFVIQVTNDYLDIYDEYVPVGPDNNKIWEKIGDTQANLDNFVSGVELVKSTSSVIGSNSTFTVTQPTVQLRLDSQGDEDVATGNVTNVTNPTVTLSAGNSGDVQFVQSVNTTKLSATASGGGVGWNSKDEKTVLTGVQVTAQPTVSLTANTATATGRIPYLESQGSATTTKLSATASGGATAWNSKDQKTVLTGVKVTSQPTVTLTANADTATGRITYLEGASANNTNVKATASGANTAWNSKDQKAAITALGTPSTESAVKSVTPTTKKLATTTVTGVSGSTTPSVVQGRTSQTTATGAGTASTTNTDWLKSISVSNGVLTIGAATMNTQTTYSANAPGTITVPTAASSATTVATGATTTSGSGASIVTDVSVGDTFDAVTGYASPTTANVIGASSTFTVTQPTVALATGADAGTGVVSLTNGVTPTTKYLSAGASGTAVGANGTATVIGSSSTFTHTDPTITIANGSTGDVTVATGIGSGTTKYLSASASGTAVGANGTASVVGANATLTHTNPTVTLASGSTGDVTVASGGTSKYMSATASGTDVELETKGISADVGNVGVAWNNKNTQTVLNNSTSLNVTKGANNI